MNIKVYHLATCKTCQRIIGELDLPEQTVFQNIKEEKLTEEQVDEMAKRSGSYESLFSRRSMKYRPLGLHEMELTEQDYRKYILQEYSFLKRPVILVDDDAIFVGNAKKNVTAAHTKIHGE